MLQEIDKLPEMEPANENAADARPILATHTVTFRVDILDENTANIGVEFFPPVAQGENYAALTDVQKYAQSFVTQFFAVVMERMQRDAT